MTIDEKRIAERRGAAIAAATFLIAVAVGIILWQVADLKWYSAVCVVMIVFGAFLIARSFGMDGELSFGPDDRSYNFAAGYLLAVFGLVWLATMFVSINIWIIAAVLLIAVAVLGIVLSMRR